MSGEIHFFCLFQTQGNEWNVGGFPARKRSKGQIVIRNLDFKYYCQGVTFQANLSIYFW